jgi:hypothetical protein
VRRNGTARETTLAPLLCGDMSSRSLSAKAGEPGKRHIGEQAQEHRYSDIAVRSEAP